MPKKKGPKGPRFGNSSAKYRRRRESINNVDSDSAILPPTVAQKDEKLQLSPGRLSIDTASFMPSPLISNEIIRRCIDGFFVHKYPIMPVLDREQTYASLQDLGEHPEQYGLVMALCAMIILQPEILGTPLSGENPHYVDQLPSTELFIAEIHRSRQFCNHIEMPSLATVQTSFFLFAALFSIGRDNSAWFHIREAMTMLQLQRLHEEDTYLAIRDFQYATYCRRTFWLLFITERAYALQRHRPLTLQKTIDLPTVSPGPEATILSGFLDLVSLFQNFDDTFLSLWNLSSSNSNTSPHSLVILQDILQGALPDVSNRTEIQQADLLVSRQWLKTMVWQLCVSKGLLSSSATNESMSFQYPVTIARDVVLVSRLLPPKAFEANGIGILEKVFDIGCSLADVLLLHPSAMHNSSLEIGSREYLMELLKILGTVQGGSSRYLNILAAKADESLQVRLRGSLSESEASNDMVVIEEIESDDDDDDDSRSSDADEGISYGIRTVDADSDFTTAKRLLTPPYAIDPSQNINTFSPTNFADQAHQIPFAVSTPDWNRILEADFVHSGTC